MTKCLQSLLLNAIRRLRIGWCQTMDASLKHGASGAAMGSGQLCTYGRCLAAEGATVSLDRVAAIAVIGSHQFRFLPLFPTLLRARVCASNHTTSSCFCTLYELYTAEMQQRLTLTLLHRI
jgi:hypothetical protein